MQSGFETVRGAKPIVKAGRLRRMDCGLLVGREGI